MIQTHPGKARFYRTVEPAGLLAHGFQFPSSGMSEPTGRVSESLQRGRCGKTHCRQAVGHENERIVWVEIIHREYAAWSRLAFVHNLRCCNRWNSADSTSGR